VTRTVLYPTRYGNKHREHMISWGHHGALEGKTQETADGGIALPVGARLVGARCVDCGEDLLEGKHFVAVERDEFDIVAFPMEEDDAPPWASEMDSPWRE
jgi:hypothetical protein